MNEKAFKQLYEEFVNTGYKGDRQEFIELLSTNTDAFMQGYNAFTSTGYNGDEDAFAELIGVTSPLKKKDEPQESGDSPLEDGQLPSDTPPETTAINERNIPQMLERVEATVNGQPLWDIVGARSADELTEAIKVNIDYEKRVQEESGMPDKTPEQMEEFIKNFPAPTERQMDLYAEFSGGNFDEILYDFDEETGTGTVIPVDTPEEAIETEAKKRQKKEVIKVGDRMLVDIIGESNQTPQDVIDKVDNIDKEARAKVTEQLGVDLSNASYYNDDGTVNLDKVNFERQVEIAKEEIDPDFDAFEEGVTARNRELRNQRVKASRALLAEFNKVESRDDLSVEDLTLLNNMLEQDLPSITNELIDNDDNEETIDFLNQKFGKYNLVFTPTTFGGMRVTRADGKADIDINIDPNISTAKETQALANFIALNADVPDVEMMDVEGYQQKAKRAQDMRRGAKNGIDGYEMVMDVKDGEFVVYPTLFPKNYDDQSSFPSSWEKLDNDDAYIFALQQNEVFKFKSQKDAEKFMLDFQGVSTVDGEAEAFYRDRGLDYTAVKAAMEEYEQVRDEIIFIEELYFNTVQQYQGPGVGPMGLFKQGSLLPENLTDPSTEDVVTPQVRELKDLSLADQKRFGHLFVNGLPVSNLQKRLPELYRRRDILFEANFSDDITRAREDFDVYLRKQYDERSKKSLDNNNKVKEAYENLEKESLLEFQVKLEDLPEYVRGNLDKLEPFQINMASKIYGDYLMLQNEQQILRVEYDIASNYFNAMENKNVKGEYIDNHFGFVNEFQKGLEQGNALNAILQYAMGIDMFDYFSDTVDPDDPMSVALAIVSSAKAKAEMGDSRTMLAWSDAKTAQESWEVFLDNPFEWATQLSANSVGQMLEFGSQIIPVAGAAGFGIGATTGPGGAVTGLGYGLRTGYAATGYAVEYTNSIFEAITEAGYDIYNPYSVELALQDEAMWEAAAARGNQRGIPIAVVNYFTAGLAGKLINKTGPVISLKSGLVKGGAITAEIGIQTTGEALSEVAGQGSEMLFGEDLGGINLETNEPYIIRSRKSFDGKEIAAEAGGSLGSGSSVTNYMVNTYMISRNKQFDTFIQNLTNPEFLSNYNYATEEQIMDYVNKAVKNKKLTEKEAQNIKKNLGLKRDAQNAAGEGAPKDVISRLMQLINAQEILGSDRNRKQIYNKKLQEIADEISTLVTTHRLSDKPTNITEGLVGLDVGRIKRFNRARNQFQIGSFVTTDYEKFKKKLNRVTDPDALFAIQVYDDNNLSEEASNLVAEKINELKKKRAAQMGIELDPSELLTVTTDIKEDAGTQQTTDEVVGSQQEGPVEKVDEGISRQRQTPTRESQEKNEITKPEEMEVGSNPITFTRETKNRKATFTEEIEDVTEENNEQTTGVKKVTFNSEIESTNTGKKRKTKGAGVPIQETRFKDFNVEEKLKEDGVLEEDFEGDIEVLEVTLVPETTESNAAGNTIFKVRVKEKGGTAVGSAIYEGIIAEESVDQVTEQIDEEAIEGFEASLEEDSRVDFKAEEQESDNYFERLSKDEQENVNKLVDFANKSFPGTMINVDSETFQNVLNDPNTQKYLKGNEVVYGITKDGDIYINPDVHKNQSSLFNTAIHEMGHIWIDYLKTTPQGVKIYNRGKELVSKTEEYKKQLKRFNGDEQKAIDETMAVLIGNKGESIVNKTLQQKFKDWLKGMWAYIKKTFKMSKDLTEEEIQDLNLDGFLNTAIADIFSGEPIELTDVQKKQLKNPDILFKKDLSIEEIIYRGRQQGLAEINIQEVLRRRHGLSKKEAVAEMQKERASVPRAFGNVEGGINVGRKILAEVQATENKRKRKQKREGKIVTTKEERAQRLQELKDNPTFKTLSELDQQRLIVAYDKEFGSVAGVETQREIQSILNELKGRKKQEKLSQGIRNRLTNIIKGLIPRSDNITKQTLTSLNKRVAEVSQENFDAVLQEVQDIARTVEQKDIQQQRKKIQDYVDKKKKTRKGTTKKPEAGTIEYRGITYFAAVDKIINMTPDELAAKQEELDAKEAQIDAALKKEAEGIDLTLDEAILLGEVEAVARFGNIEQMNVSELQEVLKALREDSKESTERLFQRRQKRREEAEKLNEQADSDIQSNNPSLFNEDGSVKTNQEFENERMNFLSSLKKRGVMKTLAKGFESVMKGYVDLFGSKNPFRGIRQMVDATVSNSRTIFNMLDGVYGTKFFEKQFHERLARANFNREQGERRVKTILDNIAKKAGIKEGREIGIPRLFQTKGPLEIKNTKGKLISYSPQMLMYQYAMSLNEDTRKRIAEQGITDEVIEQIKTHLGPEAIAYVDGVVEYLSDTYFNEVNEVYIRNNDVSLGRIDNYFPVRIDTTESIQKADMVSTKSPFMDGFRAASPKSLRARGKTGVIALNTLFDSTLDSHIESNERYKAYADDVKTFNKMLEFDSVKLLLRATGTEGIVNETLNYAVNGAVAFKNNSLKDQFINNLLGSFVAYILNNKLWQIPKQASSLIMAFTNMDVQGGRLGALGRARAKGGIKGALAQVPATMLDATVFVGRYLQLLLASLLGKEGGIKTARRISAGFENRLQDALKGRNLTQLSSGQEMGSNITVDVGEGVMNFIFKIPGVKGNINMTPKQVSERISSIMGAGTSIGDLLGVLGYLAVYNQDIANGMTETEAALRFVEYNLTQQSRRDMDKGGLQREAGLLKLFTTFGSTMLLQLNDTAYRGRNISRAIQRQIAALKEGNVRKAIDEAPTKEDIRGFTLSGALANMAFIAVANLMILFRGDDKEKEKALQEIKLQRFGVTQMAELPIFGTYFVDLAYYLDTGKQRPPFKRSSQVDPIARIGREVSKDFGEGNYGKVAETVLEFMIIKAQIDPVEASYDLIMGEGDMEQNIYEILGIPKSQRPGDGKGGGLNKTEMLKWAKENNPDLYKQLLEIRRLKSKNK